MDGVGMVGLFGCKEEIISSLIGVVDGAVY